jgi:hypothetical protein
MVEGIEDASNFDDGTFEKLTVWLRIRGNCGSFSPLPNGML